MTYSTKSDDISLSMSATVNFFVKVLYEEFKAIKLDNHLCAKNR